MSVKFDLPTGIHVMLMMQHDTHNRAMNALAVRQYDTSLACLGSFVISQSDRTKGHRCIIFPSFSASYGIKMG